MFKKLSGYNPQEELAKLNAFSDNAVSVFGNMITDLKNANDKLGSLAAKADVVADENIAMATKAGGKIQSNSDIIDKISKIMS